MHTQFKKHQKDIHKIGLFSGWEDYKISFVLCVSLHVCVCVNMFLNLHGIFQVPQYPPKWLNGKMSMQETGFDPWVRKIPWKRKWQPIPVSLPGKFHKQRSLAGYSPWGHKASDTTEHTAHVPACVCKRLSSCPWYVLFVC